MLTITRVDESGGEDDFTYSYSGNQLTSSTYDSNGNMTYDASSGFSIEWNDLNLIRKVSDGNGVLVNYTYLADGTKTRAVDADGEGLEYRGSLTFRRSSDGTLTPESIAFPGGRFVAMQGADGSIQMVPNYHIADHLGSVRTIIDGSTGQVVETNDYYAFGSRWDRSGSLIDQSNRYRYNSKEEQTTFGTPYSDYGARQYSSFNGRWLTVDPLAEKYYSYSPYAFCNNNPVNFVDPDGEDVWEINSNGIITWVEGSDEHRLYYIDSEGNRSDNYITVNNREILDAFTGKDGIASYTDDSNIDDFFKVFLFAADNSDVEWALHRGRDNRYTLGTKHDKIFAGHWEEYGLTEMPVSSVHSHPDEPNTFDKERASMSHDYDNVKDEVDKYGRQMRLNYVYFPNSTRLYHVEPSGVRYIHSIKNKYRRFYFGTLNHR